MRVGGDRPLDELDIAAGLAEFLEQEDLVGIAAGEAVGAVDDDDVESARGGVAEPVKGRAVEPRARIALVGVDVNVFEFVAVCGRPSNT